MSDAPTPELVETLRILSAMVTPAILILASSSLIGATAGRLINLLETNRQIFIDLHHHGPSSEEPHSEEELLALHEIVDTTARRVRIMQHTLVSLHVSIGVFVLAIVTIGYAALTDADIGFVPALLGMLGAVLLLYASVVLIRDSRLGVQATGVEARRLERRIDDMLGHLEPETKRTGPFAPLKRWGPTRGER